MGEFLIATAMPNLPRAEEAAAHARLALEREAALQILEDGSPAEQSPTYGAFTAEMLLLIATVAKNSGQPLAPVIDQRLARFTDFVVALSAGDGRLPALGDDDEGRVITLAAQEEVAYPASVAAAIAGYLRRDSAGPRSCKAELRDAIFGSPPGCCHLQDGIRTFRSGGITVVRETRQGRALRLLIDHGPLGYLSIAAHGHADANSIILSIDDEPVLVDPGTYLYHSGGLWRDWFRGTPAHNTLSIGGANQSVISGPFNWAQKAQASLNDIRAGQDWSINVSHDGYRRRFGVDHARRIEAGTSGFVVTDRLLPLSPELEVEVTFQFAPSIMLEHANSEWRASRNGNPMVRFHFEPKGEVTLKAGEPAPSGGWVSPGFGTKVPAPRLTWGGRLPETGLRTHFILDEQ
jgi:uncharacterized heparinase superfamily protein